MPARGGGLLLPGHRSEPPCRHRQLILIIPLPLLATGCGWLMHIPHATVAGIVVLSVTHVLRDAARHRSCHDGLQEGGPLWNQVCPLWLHWRCGADDLGLLLEHGWFQQPMVNSKMESLLTQLWPLDLSFEIWWKQLPWTGCPSLIFRDQ